MSEKRYIKVLDEEKNESTLELPKFINYIKVSKEEDMNVSPKEYETIIYAFDDYTLLNKVDKSNIEIVQSKKISEDIQNIIKDKVSLFNEMLQETNLEISENVKKAEATYEADMKKINKKETKIDTELSQLEAERTAIKTEQDSVKTVAKDNVNLTFKLFS